MGLFFRAFLIGLWFFLLGIPLMGLFRSFLTGIVISGIILLYHLLKKWVEADLFRNISEDVLDTVRSLKEDVSLELLWFALSTFLIVFPLLANRYMVDVATLAGIYILLALGLNIVVGFTGLLNLGYVAFYAIGAYSYAILSTRAGISFWLGLPIGGILSAVAGLLIGIPVLRLRGDYLAIVTLGFGEVVRIVLNNWDRFTNGPNGILNIPRPKILSFTFIHPMHYYYLILIIGLITIFIISRLNNSRLGRAWAAIREDELAAEAMGIDVTKSKLLAFSIGACWAGLAGVFFAGKMAFISPESFTFFESVIILAMVVLGGMGSIPGVIIGAVVLVVLPEMMRGLAMYRMLIFGIAIVAVMTLRPQGILGAVKRRVFY